MSKAKGRIFEIKRFAVHDGDGIRTTVFLKGCPLRCVWCHNPEGIGFLPELAYHSHKCISCGECVAVCPVGAHTIENGKHHFYREKCTACGACASSCFGEALTLYGKEMTVEELLPILLEDREFYKKSGGGVTLSGGECLAQADFCSELLAALKKEGINTAVDTCGAIPRAAIDKVLPYTDVFLYDLKAYDTALHKECTGRGNEDIIDNLRYIDSCEGTVEIRIPYVPELNAHELGKIAELLKDFKNITRVRVLPYHNYAGSKYDALDMDNTLPKRLPTDDEIRAAEQLFTFINNK